MFRNSFCHLSCFLGLLLLLLLLGSEAHTGKKELSCQKNPPNKTTRIGVVFDSGSRIGKQQMIAIEMALRRFHLSSSSCVKLELLLLDSHQNFTSRSHSSALNLITDGGVKAVVGSVTKKELIFMSDHKIPVGIPIISTSAAQFQFQLQPLKTPSLIQMANNITHHMQCIASILSHFQWPRKVSVFYEITSIDHPSFELAHSLFDSFQSVNIEIDHFLALSSSSNQAEILIENELKKLINNQRNGVFIVTQISLELATLVFTKAKKMNMVGNGYTWIVSDDVFDLIDSLDSSSSLLNKMDGVIGFRTYFDNTKKSFKTNFKKMYNLEYPEDEEPTNASIFAIRAYDAIWAITRAIEKLDEKFTSNQLMEKILESNFEGLNGMVKFKNGMLISQAPIFQILRVMDKSFKEVAFWTPKLGFSESSLVENNKKAAFRSNEENLLAVKHLSKTSSSRKLDGDGEIKRLKFAVPGQGACPEFVNVSNDVFTGFSIDVFKAVMNNINIPSSSYDLIPYYHTYNDMIDAVYKKEYDGAVGDITILAERFQAVDFTLAYLKTDIVMVVTEKQEKWKKWWAFMEAFELQVWFLIPIMHLFISSIIWLIERQNNHELKSLGNMLWFSISIIFYIHREAVKNGLTRLVLGPWLFGILVVTASFSASLTSMMTISWSQPSVLDVETLKKMDATVGCNSESFICIFLNQTLKFEPSKIMKMNSIDDYPQAFKNGSIKAAFFITPHAEVFLAKNCGRYTKAVSSFKLGGIGFAFQKGSALAANVSKSIAELTLTNDISQMEQNLLDSFKCSSTDKADGLGLGPGPFVGLFITCGSIALLVLLYMGFQFMKTKLDWIKNPKWSPAGLTLE